MEVPEYKELSIKSVWPKFKDDKYLILKTTNYQSVNTFMASLLPCMRRRSVSLFCFREKVEPFPRKLCKMIKLQLILKFWRRLKAWWAWWVSLNYYFININLTSKGRSNFLLKIKTTAITRKRQEKIHQTDFSIFTRKKNVSSESNDASEKQTVAPNPFVSKKKSPSEEVKEERIQF